MSRKDNPDYRPRHVKRKNRPENRKPTKTEPEVKQSPSNSGTDDFFYGVSPLGGRKKKYASQVVMTDPEPSVQSTQAAAETAVSKVKEGVQAARASEREEIAAEPGDHTPDAVEPEATAAKAVVAAMAAQAAEEPKDDAPEATEQPEPIAEQGKPETVQSKPKKPEPKKPEAEKKDGAEPVPTANQAPEQAPDKSADQAAPPEPQAEAVVTATVAKSGDAPAPIRIRKVDIDTSDVKAHDDGSDASQGHKPKRKKRHGKRIAIAILCVILALVVGIVGTFFVMNEMGRRKMHNNEGMEVVMPTADSSGSQIISADKYGRIVNYNGVSYTFNDDIIALTMIGVDNGSGTESELRMADAIYILTINAKTGETKILGVSRDTMTDVDIFSAEGTYINAEKRQIAYSYAYHGTTMTSGDNTNKSVSRLFFGLPCKNYFAINLEALTTLNDAIGGVTVTSKLTFKSPEDGRVINEGDEVTLHGKEAEIYVRKRDITQLESNNVRMERQQQYIRAFLSSVFSAAKKDISVVSDLYSAIKSNSDSSLDLTRLTYIASTAVTKLGSSENIEYINLKGKIVEGTNAEMYVSNDDVLRTMLDVFYTPMNTDE